MIIKSAIIFLSVFDFVCDAYDGVVGLFSRVSKKETFQNETVIKTAPTYFYR
ncbi:MAG: hypothetical protein JEZ09_09250 [Salinivirgaceae bacterium]|nr:hypothetical protein [Salinivirgaceae bacterium]